MNAIERDDKIPERESQPAAVRPKAGIAWGGRPASYGLGLTGLTTVMATQLSSGCEMIDHCYLIDYRFISPI